MVQKVYHARAICQDYVSIIHRRDLNREWGLIACGHDPLKIKFQSTIFAQNDQKYGVHLCAWQHIEYP